MEKLLDLLWEDMIEMILPLILDTPEYCQFIYKCAMSRESEDRLNVFLKLSDMAIGDIDKPSKCHNGLKTAFKKDTYSAKHRLLGLNYDNYWYSGYEGSVPITKIIPHATIILGGIPFGGSGEYVKVLSDKMIIRGYAFSEHTLLKTQLPNLKELVIEENVSVTTDIALDTVSFPDNSFLYHLQSTSSILSFATPPKQFKIKFYKFGKLAYEKCVYNINHVQAAINMVTHVELFSNVSMGGVVYPSVEEVDYRVHFKNMCNIDEFSLSFPNLKYVHLDSKFHDEFNEKTHNKYELI